MIDYEQYLRMGEPDKAERARNWAAAIGLQAVDGLQTSEYLRETARRNIEGEISIDEVQRLVRTYYVTKTTHDDDDDEKSEADKVSANIAKLLGEPSFLFSVVGITSIHRRIFDGVFKHAGKIRDYEISKKEWVLRGDSVLYGNAVDLRRALEYDLQTEKEFSYKGLAMTDVVAHVAKFISGLWQIHPFCEGNTRTTAVFCIKYLRSMGFDVSNDLFAEKSWYFRNALVRANYHNYAKGIDYEPKYLILFFRNLLLGESNELHNRYMIINPPKEWQEKFDEITKNTVQVPYKLRTSTVQVEQLISAIGEDKLSVKEMLARLGLKHRENFLTSYLTPAIKEGIVSMLYPDSPRHPRQKYYLTVKGVAIHNTLKDKKV